MKKIQSAKDAYEYAKRFALEDSNKDRMILIYTEDDGTVVRTAERGENIAIQKIYPGQGGTRAIIVTNHPSGNSLPDKYDIAETKRMKELLELNDIGLTDQIIVGYKEFYSYAEEEITVVK